MKVYQRAKDYNNWTLGSAAIQYGDGKKPRIELRSWGYIPLHMWPALEEHINNTIREFEQLQKEESNNGN